MYTIHGEGGACIAIGYAAGRHVHNTWGGGGGGGGGGGEGGACIGYDHNKLGGENALLLCARCSSRIIWIII